MILVGHSIVVDPPCVIVKQLLMGMHLVCMGSIHNFCSLKILELHQISRLKISLWLAPACIIAKQFCLMGYGKERGILTAVQVFF